jgi:hypothetical protein
MKKIRNRSDLVAEKLRLRVQELELEKSIRSDWHGLKEDLKLKNLLKKNLHDEAHGDRHWLVNCLSIGASILTKKVMDSAGEKLGDKVEKGMDNMLGKVQGFFERRKKRKG